jgi:hypothetical protein
LDVGLRLARQQRPQARVDPFDVLVGECRCDHRVDVVEQVLDVRGAGGGVGEVERPVRVGRPDDPVPAPRDDEQHRLLGAQDQPRVRADAVAGHDEVDPLARPDVELPALPGQPLRLVGPHAGGVDDLPGPDVEHAARLQVVHLGADDPLALLEQPDDPRPRRHVRAVGRGRAGDEHRVARVVHLRVVVLQCAHQRVLLQRGDDAPGPAAGEVAVVRDAPGPARQQTEGVVERDSRAGVEPLPAAALQRVDEGHRLDQVRRELLDEQPALLQRLGHEPEVEHLEVAQAAVDEFARPARRAGREVAGLDQPDGQTAGGGVERGTRADDTAADDQDVELTAGFRRRRQCIQRAFPGCGGEGDRSHGRVLSGRAGRAVPLGSYPARCNSAPRTSDATVGRAVTAVNQGRSTWSNTGS